MNTLEPWWSSRCSGALLDSVSLLAEWERDLLLMSVPQTDSNSRSRALQSLSDQTKKLWNVFNTEREKLDRDYMSEEGSFLAYLSAFFVPNIERTRHALSSSRAAGVLEPLLESETLNILDFGAGPLSCSFGFLIALGELATRTKINRIKNIHIVATERSERAVRIGQKWLEKVLDSKFSIQIERRTAVPKDLLFDVVLAANVLNEIPDKHHIKTLQLLKSSLYADDSGKKSILLILEPGQDIHSRKLVTLRDETLSSLGDTNFRIVAPCPHTLECPLSPQMNRSDWCWFRCKFMVPTFQAELDRKSQIDHRELAYSYLLLSGSPKEKTKEPWAICVSDEMPVGDTEGQERRSVYFKSNQVGEKKINEARIEDLARQGFKTKLCCSNGKLLGAIREKKSEQESYLRGLEVDKSNSFELYIAER